ncbi:uncharacterized protein BDV17DRAFT_278972 [Aspergillus undulatus]|uniref:uncharacterized protein n=1 Tax=Aspergillus undulatus TaxID=1810928 RepID=UPI003CCDDE91
MSSLLSLPLEPLDRVSEYVASEYNLYELTLVNRYCYFVASKHQLAHIRINVTDQISFKDDVQCWTDQLGTASAFAAVRLFPSLLQILHQQLRHCGLHIRASILPSLHQHANRLHNIDEHDFTLATSPGLASVLLPVPQYDDEGNVEYNEEAVMRIAAGLAPNLTDVHIVHRGLRAGSEILAAVDLGRPPWRGPSPSKMRCFRPWERYLVFSALRSLQLWAVDLETLTSIRSHRFSSLRVLAIELEYPQDANRHYCSDKARRLDEAASAFLLSLALLQSIHISGSSHCEKARTHGNADEIASYQALGALSNLTELSLHLRLTDSVPDSMSNLRDMLISGAVESAKYSRKLLLNAEDDELDIKTHVREVINGPTKRIPLDEIDECYRLGPSEKAFRSLWPAKTGHWVHDWHSFPLGSKPPIYEA